MKIKTNDNVKVIHGTYRNKTGKVLQVFPQLKKASVEGINSTIKNIKSQKQGEKGQRISFPAPIAISNLSLICSKCGKNTRAGFKRLSDGNRARICKKCKEVID